MGAWSGEVFGNDTAADWAADLVEDGSPEDVRATLSVAADRAASDYLEAPEGSEALAAAEVVAAAAGRPVEPDSYSGDVIAWAGGHPELGDPQTIDLVRRAIDRVGAGESELRDLWLDDADADPAAAREWTDSLDDLSRRLAAAMS